MFDVGFWELSLIGIVALLVIGPERLPAVARTVGKWVGRANRFISSVKDDINKELKDEDLKRILAEQQKLADEYKNAASEMSSSIASATESLQGRESAHMDDLLELDEDDVKPEPSKTSTESAKPEPQKADKGKESSATQENKPSTAPVSEDVTQKQS